MAEVTSTLLGDLSDYFDSVREECQHLLVCMTSRFLPPQIDLNEDLTNLVQILKTNVKGGWPNAMNGQLKDAAKMESDMLRYLFKDASLFLHKAITIFLDESHGKENL